jgi:hypothetical protein
LSSKIKLIIYSPDCIFCALDKNEDYIDFKQQLNVNTFQDDIDKYFDYAHAELEAWKISENLIDKRNASSYRWKTKDFQNASFFINCTKHNKNSRFRYE